jgi:hypothetical protein
MPILTQTKPSWLAALSSGVDLKVLDTQGYCTRRVAPFGCNYCHSVTCVTPTERENTTETMGQAPSQRRRVTRALCCVVTAHWLELLVAGSSVTFHRPNPERMLWRWVEGRGLDETDDSSGGGIRGRGEITREGKRKDESAVVCRVALASDCLTVARCRAQRDVHCVALTSPCRRCNTVASCSETGLAIETTRMFR